MELALSIPTYAELEPLLRPGLEFHELGRSLHLSLATPRVPGLDVSQFWTFIAKYLCSFQSPSFNKGTRSYSEGCPGLLKTHFARSSGLGIATTECALQDTPIAGLWGATYEVEAEDNHPPGNRVSHYQLPLTGFTREEYGDGYIRLCTPWPPESHEPCVRGSYYGFLRWTPRTRALVPSFL